MDLRICKKCRRMYQSAMNKAFCPDCMAEDEKLFQKVKSYIWDHTGCSVMEVAKECGCTEQQIKTWLRENRLQMGTGAKLELECESCGMPIAAGRFCQNCLKQLNQAADELKEKTQQAVASTSSAPSTGAGASRGISYHTTFGR